MQQTLTIMHTEASVSLGGQGIRILNESLWMRERGHRLIIVAPEHSGLVREAQDAGLETLPLRFAKKTQVSDYFRLVCYLRQTKPDVLNTHSSVDSWVGCLAGRSCQVPAIIRTRHLSTPVRTHILNRWLYRSLCDHVFTTAECTSNALIEDLGLPHKVSTVSTGIQPPDTLPPREEARGSLIQELDLASDARFIGCLAVLRGWKGHTILLDAFRNIAARIPQYHLLIVGEGAQRCTLQHLITKWGLQNRVHLIGHRRDFWFVLRALDVKVLASTGGEGISQSLLQAQFAGCPVIGSDAGGIPEVITHEKTGLLVPKGKAAPLGQSLLRLIHDRALADHVARNAYKQVHVHHTIDVMGHKLLSHYQALLLDTPLD